jgi:glyoxylase-like metal-dependent hydrolase (beta-lactamase superfamily II)
MFYKEIKKNGISLKDITYILATHYHPDHMGLVGELVNMGVKFLVMDTQVPNLHFSDEIFSRDKILRLLPSVPEDKAEVIACKNSRAFLAALGIDGEIVSTPEPQRGQHNACSGQRRLLRGGFRACGVYGRLRGE